MDLPILDDRRGRPMRSLRISVTDQCNLRCGYCMPEDEYTWLPRSRILRYGQITEFVKAAVQLGVTRIRLTGGEPLLRKELWRLIEQISLVQGVADLALTTNGVLLADRAEEIFGAGLQRLTVSLDSLRPKRYKELTRYGNISRVMEGLRVARDICPTRIKINCVIMAGVNDDELEDLMLWSWEQGYELRLIEYMDVAGATQWSPDRVLPRSEILRRLEAAFGSPAPLQKEGAAPADRFSIKGHGTFGIISSTSTPFCGTCDRLRLTADGTLFTCLYADKGFDMGAIIRKTNDPQFLLQELRAIWGQRNDRGAEERLALAGNRGILAPASELKDRPLSEMHSKGG